MADVLDVAKYILNKVGKTSAWKLHKLCYYSQAWSLAWTDKPIFKDDFAAHKNGTLCLKLFNKHSNAFVIDSAQFPYGFPERLTADERETINIVLRDYGDIEPYALQELICSEEPWKQTAQGSVIEKEIMKKFYRNLLMEEKEKKTK